MSDTTGAIREDATNTVTALTDEQAEQAFLDRWQDAEEPSTPDDTGERGSDEEDTASDEHESGDTTDENDEVHEDAEEAEQAETKSERRIAADDDEVEVKVGDETLKLSVKDLKRLHGQEYALNKKSEAVADLRKFNESKAAFLDKKLDAGLERAEKRWKEYEGIDLNLAAADLATGRLSEAQYQALKAEMVERWDDLQAARKERSEFRNAVEAERTRDEQERFERVKAQIIAKHPNVDELAPKLQRYVTEQGLTQAEIRQFFHPALFDLMNKARLYDEAQARKPEIKKVVAEPKKVLKPQTSSTNQRSTKADDAMRDLRRSGSTDDAVKALMARMGD
ncbi:hypothetical protein [Roseomonas chloroacetimidivorans]|uniref:hypothetical protein n=1 Tax=Roseomonas chloroacetimidivorans TaxID=1766656 RepID=UPI003C761C9C